MTTALSVPAILRAEARICDHGGARIEVNLIAPDGSRAVQLNVDEAYFDPRFPVPPVIERDGLGLRLQATDFAPWPPEVRPHQSEGPYLRMLFSDFSDFGIWANSLALTNLGLRHSDNVTLTEIEAPYGLREYSAPYSSPFRKGGLSFGTYDQFFSRNDTGEISDIVTCLRPGRTPYQACQHRVDLGTFDIEVDYDTAFLPEWQRISDDVRAFYACVTDKTE